MLFTCIQDMALQEEVISSLRRPGPVRMFPLLSVFFTSVLFRRTLRCAAAAGHHAAPEEQLDRGVRVAPHDGRREDCRGLAVQREASVPRGPRFQLVRRFLAVIPRLWLRQQLLSHVIIQDSGCVTSAIVIPCYYTRLWLRQQLLSHVIIQDSGCVRSTIVIPCRVIRLNGI